MKQVCPQLLITLTCVLATNVTIRYTHHARVNPQLQTLIGVSVSQTLQITCLHCNVLPHISVPHLTGDITLPSLPSSASYGVSRSPTVQSTSKKTLEYASERNKDICSAESIVPAYDVIGDNMDLMKSPSNMSSKQQRESLHWFLNVAVQRRVVSSLPDDRPIADIMAVPNHAFIPSTNDCDALERNWIFHIVKVVTKYIDCLSRIKDLYQSIKTTLILKKHKKNNLLHCRSS